ncbi:FAD-dependent oxidoreductase [Rhizobium sp. CFBP 8762]|uniref:FAD-dependent oxidoreductase n=1 Tax=Rhizobium sp. CFBP 8762 TaxID=2775279 RepID=UPI001784533A|nr:FAD-dependent oxidoreductase [Rhizobium sp. CFBP 8762]MBD8555995.1 FAD-dependent oxidoreductase [Rhizobium sp. CFBP 8762]
MQIFDVIVIGGGITGAAAANHLIAAGHSTLLVEAGDFGAVTTSRTSRLQYCGLAYLNGFESFSTIATQPQAFAQRLGLARRSMRERSAFVRQSPERLQTVDFYLPIYARDAASPWKMKAGFRLLDMMDTGGEGLTYTFLDANAARAIPMLTGASSRGALVGAIHYVEYQYNWPERICVDTVMNAAEAGAEVRNYCPVQHIEREGDGWRVTCFDKRTKAPFSATARAIVNAAGPWVDTIARAAGISVAQLNQGEKGTNIALRLPAEFRGQGLQTLSRSGAPFYLIPWGALHYAGPVNSSAEADAKGFVAQDNEITSLIDELNDLFPDLNLGHEDIVYSWAGVRPRTYAPSAPSGGSGLQLHTPAMTGLPGYYVYTGGLLMMHGQIGREIATAVTQAFSPSREPQAVKVGPRPLAATDQRGVITSVDGVSVPVSALNDMVARESVMTLEDVMFRRASFGWNEHLGTDVVEDVAEAVRETAGWSKVEAGLQIMAYRETVNRSYKFRG